MILSCGHEPTPTAISAGFAGLPDGRMVCYPCADAIQRAELVTTDRYTAYLSRDAQSVTTWTGGVLGRVTSHHTSRAARKTYVRVTDVHGQHWHGQGPAESGTYVGLRRVRTP